MWVVGTLQSSPSVQCHVTNRVCRWTWVAMLHGADVASAHKDQGRSQPRPCTRTLDVSLCKALPGHTQVRLVQIHANHHPTATLQHADTAAHNRHYTDRTWQHVSLVSPAHTQASTARVCVCVCVCVCRSVRTESAVVLGELVSGTGKAAASHVKSLLPLWWLAQFDPNADAANAASSAYQVCPHPHIHTHTQIPTQMRA